MPREDPEDRSIAELLKQLTEQTQTLVRDEIRLAMLELKDKGRKAGVGAGLFGAGGMVALFGVGTLIAALVLALATAMQAWLAALIVAVVLLAGAAVLALTGKREIEGAIPPVPQEAVASAKDDVAAVREHVAHRNDADVHRPTETVRR